MRARLCTLGILEPDNAVSLLLAHFAPVLLADTELRVVYAGTSLEPADAIAARSETEIPFGSGATRHRAHLQIIEWKAGKHRSLHFGPDPQHFVLEESANELEPQFAYSAYVSWDGLDQSKIAQLALGEMDDGDAGALVRASREAIREHFEKRRQDRRRGQVAKWKGRQGLSVRGHRKDRG